MYAKGQRKGSGRGADCLKRIRTAYLYVPPLFYCCCFFAIACSFLLHLFLLCSIIFFFLTKEFVELTI